jgi:glycosyltransferase involved in cell wall biosynthesis
MHVLYLHQYFCTLSGVSGTRSYEFAKRWVAAGHDVTVITSGAFLPEVQNSGARTVLDIDGIDVHVIRVPYSNSMGARQRLVSYFGFAARAALASRRVSAPDIVFATSTPLTIGIPGVMAKKSFRCPMVFEVRDLWPAVPIELGWIRNPVLIKSARMLERWIYRHSSAIVALSPGIAAGVEAAGVPPHRIVVAPNCSDNDLFHPEIDGGGVREIVDGDKFVAIYVGSLGRANRVSVLLDVARILEQRNAPVRIIVLGDGYERRAIEQGVRDLGLSSIRVFDPVPKQDLPRWLTAADVGLILFDRRPILGTNSPNKFFDYCAAGRPSLINVDGWVADLIEDEAIGVAVRGGEALAIAEGIQALERDRESCRAMGVRARRLAESQFDRDRISAVVLDTLVSVSGGPVDRWN